MDTSSPPAGCQMSTPAGFDTPNHPKSLRTPPPKRGGLTSSLVQHPASPHPRPGLNFTPKVTLSRMGYVGVTAQKFPYQVGVSATGAPSRSAASGDPQARAAPASGVPYMSCLCRSPGRVVEQYRKLSTWLVMR